MKKEKVQLNAKFTNVIDMRLLMAEKMYGVVEETKDPQINWILTHSSKEEVQKEIKDRYYNSKIESYVPFWVYPLAVAVLFGLVIVLSKLGVF